jgi:hypothetical protein
MMSVNGGQPRQMMLRASAVITVLILLVRFHTYRFCQNMNLNE